MPYRNLITVLGFDIAAIRAAIEESKVRGGAGGGIYFPSGTYELTDTIHIEPGVFLRFVGNSNTDTIFKWVGSPGGVMIHADHTTHDFSIENIRLEGGIDDLTGVQLNRLIEPCTEADGDLIQLHAKFINVVFSHLDVAIKSYSETDELYVNCCHFLDVTTGIVLNTRKNSGANFLVANSIFNRVTTGISIEAGSQFSFISNQFFDFSTGIIIDRADSLFINNNTFISSKHDAIHLNLGPTGYASGHADDLMGGGMIIANHFQGSGDYKDSQVACHSQYIIGLSFFGNSFLDLGIGMLFTDNSKNNFIGHNYFNEHVRTRIVNPEVVTVNEALTRDWRVSVSISLLPPVISAAPIYLVDDYTGAAIQHGIDTLFDSLGEAEFTILLKDGVYCLKDSLRIPNSASITLMGANIRTTTLQWATPLALPPGRAMISGRDVGSFHLRQLRLIGEASHGKTRGLVLEGDVETRALQISDVIFSSMELGIEIDVQIIKSVISNSWFFDLKYGVLFLELMLFAHFFQNEFRGVSTTAIEIKDSRHVELVRNSIQYAVSGWTGIKLERCQESALIAGNYFEGHGDNTTFLDLKSPAEKPSKNIKILSTHFGGAPAARRQVAVDLDYADDVMIGGCVFLDAVSPIHLTEHTARLKLVPCSFSSTGSIFSNPRRPGESPPEPEVYYQKGRNARR